MYVKAFHAHHHDHWLLCRPVLALGPLYNFNINRTRSHLFLQIILCRPTFCVVVHLTCISHLIVCKTVKIVLQCTLPVDQGLGLLVNLFTKCTANFQLNPPCSQITTAVCFSLFRYTLERLHMQFLMFLSPKNTYMHLAYRF